MTQWFAHMSASQQVGLLFAVVFGLLSLATVVVFAMSFREHADTPQGHARRLEYQNLQGLLKTSWVVMGVFWVGWASGDTVATVLFGVVSFFTLREFITLSPTRRGDHRSLILAFFVVLPVQFALVGLKRFDLFTVFIPVYVFLAIPVVSALANDPQRFLERNAKLQWGIMVCVFGMSHVPALLLLEFPGYAGRNAFLVFFLVIVVQTCMLVQHMASRLMPHPPVAPDISQAFNWRSWWTGLAVAGVVGALMTSLTPFVPGQALAMALIACASGSLGHLVMKALKRDRGVPTWGGQGQSTTGASGLLDRVDAICFAAPVFFHSLRWKFGL